MSQTEMFQVADVSLKYTAESPAPPRTATSGDSHPWWSSLRHGGCLIAPSRLTEFFPSAPERPLPAWTVDRLRRAVLALREEGGKGVTDRLLDTVLVHVLGLESEYWAVGSHVDAAWSVKAVTGEILKPRRLWQEPNGGLLPVFLVDDLIRGRGVPPPLGLGRGRRWAARVVEWLRKKNQKIALLTNGYQWRLIHAGPDYDAWAEWDTHVWFLEGRPGPQVDALRVLLGREALAAPAHGVPGPLVQAILATRRGQAELSALLGERVRQAVELLVRESRASIDQILDDPGAKVTKRDVYVAAVRLVMRLVVILFAEARDRLLPVDNPVYYRSYSLRGLIELLDREGGGHALDRLRDRYGAWPRLLGLFLLLHRGSDHEKLPVTRYGGNLFMPGDRSSADPVLRALSALESARNEIHDGVIAGILHLLSQSPVKIRQGRGSKYVMTPVDFSQLDTEYIGILYEGLLDYELRRTDEGVPLLFLNLGRQPALPLDRLEEMDDKALADLVKNLGKPEKGPSLSESEAGEEDDEEDEETAEDAEEEESREDEEEEESGDASAGVSLTSVAFDDSDTARIFRERAHRWARRAAAAGKLVSRPRGKLTDEKLKAYESELDRAASSLVGHLILPGEYYLVRFGGTRKGSGTYYTRPALAGPTIRRTLEPLAYADDGPRPPADILDLKVADIACGSGSFLVGALRYLTGVLYESLLHHGWLKETPDGRILWARPKEAYPPWFAEALQDFSGLNEPARRPRDLEGGQSPEEKIRARLKRIVVERCLYGVDLDPLAVELARLALWIETMDPYLPFSFLDHKIKVGNAFVGCWFDCFQDYPALAWVREGGDRNHSNGVHFPKEGWTRAIGRIKRKTVKDELADLIRGLAMNPSNDLFGLPERPDRIHDDLVARWAELHEQRPDDPEAQQQIYAGIQNDPRYRRLRRAFDTWCAVWFWPADRLDIAPTPSRFCSPPEDTAAEVERLAAELRFFHWELEFPDVFSGPNTGFSAIVGNPPWETLKPNSKEWFSNHDPLYRTYGKQEAVAKQKSAFSGDPGLEREWLGYNARLKALSNWKKNVARPFGDVTDDEGDSFSLSSKRGESARLHEIWAEIRAGRDGYADPWHPFRHQGSADINSYKMFLELAHALVREGGRVGLIVPSGIYTDSGSVKLRELFLDRCRWEWLFGFENRNKVFDIDSRFKFCPVILEKGGQTEAIRAAFMRHDIADWEEGERYVLDYPADRIVRFSPRSKAVLEVRDPRDLAVLEKMYTNGVLLGDNSKKGWGIRYAREFDMTNDSKLFPPRPQWEAKGYVPDEYGHWLKGPWRAIAEVFPGRAPSDLWREEGWVCSRDGKLVIALDEIEDVALPLYQGTMIHQYDFSFQSWVRGTGLTATWEATPWEKKIPGPQFLLSLDDFAANAKASQKFKLAFRDIARSTDERTFIAAVVPGLPCGNVLGVLDAFNESLRPTCAVLNSLVCDYATRERIGGTHLNLYLIEELPLLPKHRIAAVPGLQILAAQLCFTSELFSGEWLAVKDEELRLSCYCWRSFWALTTHERLRLRCILDAVVAHLYGLDEDDFRWILRDCDHPAERVTNKAFARTLDPKGFWRVDKTQDPELRHTVLAQVAFADLQTLIAAHGEEEALRRFLGTGPDDGWMIPETLRLADYNLGHDERARRPCPVAERLGPRFYEFQLAQSPEESWAECRAHAARIARIRRGSLPAGQSPRVDQSGQARKSGPVVIDDLFSSGEPPPVPPQP